MTCKHLSIRCRFTRKKPKLIHMPLTCLQSYSLKWQITKNQALSATREMLLIRQHSESNKWLFCSKTENRKRSCFIRDFKGIKFCLCCFFFVLTVWFFRTSKFCKKVIIWNMVHNANLWSTFALKRRNINTCIKNLELQFGSAKSGVTTAFIPKTT